MKFKPLIVFCSVLILLVSACKKEPAVTPVIPTNDGEEEVISKTLSVNNVLQSNMVIQRDKPFKVWGKATAGSKIDIRASWDNSTYIAETNANGNWETTIPASPVNSSAQKVTITTAGLTPLELNNILIGDVWICSGQSNMVMQVGNIPPFQGVDNFRAEIAAANYPEIRFLTVQENYSKTAADVLFNDPEWKVCSPETAANMSAVAYYFGRKINAEVDVPVGLIVSAVNGTWCETWMNAEAFNIDPVINSYIGRNQSSALYNGMLAPFAKIGIKGFLWYQGENNQNISPPAHYTKLNSELIQGWRTIFNQGELPFYYVQLTPFDANTTGNTLANGLAKFREAQAAVRQTSGTGMVVTMDVGEVGNHHPKYKRQVGERLALLALNGAYQQSVQSVGPQYASYKKVGNTIVVEFVPGTANNLNTINNELLKQHFLLAGSDLTFTKAEATIDNDKIVISIPADLPLPVMAVRYAFSNFPVTNLQNNAGLPAEPFRTDNWSN
ncbi:MAG: sialate O-acetylesterase [Sphingobacteriaceae bacterium]|nr:MAG: sialate O-acetylesterase [Sphingobacteriaceae bacterium]